MCAPRPWAAAHPLKFCARKPHCGEMPAIAGSRHRGARAASRGPAPARRPAHCKGQAASVN